MAAHYFWRSLLALYVGLLAPLIYIDSLSPHWGIQKYHLSILMPPASMPIPPEAGSFHAPPLRQSLLQTPIHSLLHGGALALGHLLTADPAPVIAGPALHARLGTTTPHRILGHVPRPPDKPPRHLVV